MEKDIEILEEQLKQNKRHLENYEKDDCLTSVYYGLKKYAEALEHLIKAYKELGELYKSEKKMKNQYVELYQDVLLKENVIPVSLVEEKIEELNKLITEAQKELGSASKEYTIYVYQKDILQELLEKRK